MQKVKKVKILPIEKFLILIIVVLSILVPIGTVFTKKSQLGNYMSDPALTQRTKSINALFEDDRVMIDLMARKAYFPSQYLNVESTKNPYGNYLDGDGYFFYRDKELKTFD